MKVSGFEFLAVSLIGILTLVGAGAYSRQAGAKEPVTESKEGFVANSAQDLASLDRWRSSLSEERQILERQAERQYVAIEKLTDKVLWVFGIIATVAIAAFAWFFGKSKNDFDKTIKKTFTKQAKEIVEKETSQVRQLYGSLRAEVDDLSAYKSRQLAWVEMSKTDADKPAASEPVARALHAMGLQNISFVNPEPGKDFELGDPDLVILTFDGTDEARRLLSIIVQHLKQKSPPVPLLIYTFSKSIGAQIRLDEADLRALDGFDWYIPVNFPAQLLAQSQLLMRRSRKLLGGSRGEL